MALVFSVHHACGLTLGGQIEALRALPAFTPADAAEASRQLFRLYLKRVVMLTEYPDDDDRRAGWAQCHLHLVALAGERIHAVDARTGESAPLGVALRMFDLHTGAAYYRERLGERPLALLTGTLTDLLLRMCQTGGVDRRHYLLTASLLRCHPGGVRVAAPLARGGRVMYALFLRQRLDWLAMHRPTDDRYVEQDLLALEPTPADVRSAVCPYTGNTLLHWAALNRGCSGWAARRALALSCAAHVLMQRLGADPCAVNHAGETPLQLAEEAWGAVTLGRASYARAGHPLVETFRIAMADVRARRLAFAMGTHPRLGAASPFFLLALELGVLTLILNDVGVGERLARSPAVAYASRLRCVLRSDHSGLEVPPFVHFVGSLMDGAVLRRSALTPRMRQRLLLGAQIDTNENLEAEVVRVFKRLRRVRRRFRLPDGDFTISSMIDGTAHAFFDAMREVARRQVERGLLPRRLQ